MKAPLLAFVSFATALALSLPAARADSVIVNLRIGVQMVSMPLTKGLPLLPKLRGAESIESAFGEIQEMIAAGDATLVGFPELVTKSGQRAVTEDIQEVRYATAFESPTGTPASVSEEVKKTTTQTDRSAGAGAPVPSKFETRNVGSTLEAEPVVGPDGTVIDLNIVPQHVRLLGFSPVAAGRDANGHDWQVQQPQFFSAKTTTSLSLRNGQRTLLAEFRGPEGSDQILFFILKAEVVPIGELQKQ